MLNHNCTVAADSSLNPKTSSEVLKCFRLQTSEWVSVHLVAVVSAICSIYAAGYLLTSLLARSKDGLYEPALADSEREAVADLLQYLENVRASPPYFYERYLDSILT